MLARAGNLICCPVLFILALWRKNIAWLHLCKIRGTLQSKADFVSGRTVSVFVCSETFGTVKGCVWVFLAETDILFMGGQCAAQDV